MVFGLLRIIPGECNATTRPGVELKWKMFRLSRPSTPICRRVDRISNVKETARLGKYNIFPVGLEELK